MAPDEIVRLAGAEGITLSVTGPETLNANPASRMTPDVRNAIRENKWPLMNHLLEQEGDRLMTEWFENQDVLTQEQHDAYNREHDTICRWLRGVQNHLQAVAA
jgi:hypothetical protein